MYLEIPEEVLLSLKVPKRDTERCLRAELAIRLYERGLLGFRKARELACMTK
jgi:predicted HTH domain antitoxin